MTDLSDEVEAAAAAPRRVTADGTTVEQHSLRDLILAEQRQKSNGAVAHVRRGMNMVTLKPPGTIPGV